MGKESPRFGNVLKRVFYGGLTITSIGLTVHGGFGTFETCRDSNYNKYDIAGRDFNPRVDKGKGIPELAAGVAIGIGLLCIPNKFSEPRDSSDNQS